MSNEHELAVNEISRTIFTIPYYQRGYRWTEKEVTSLLDDLLAFAEGNTSKDPYCLQPLVIQEIADGEINVVDGQQRLTTIAIILLKLEIKFDWDIKYTAENNKLLKELFNNPGNSINDHFRNGTKTTVDIWLQKEPSRAKTLSELLQGTLDKRVVFLRYELSKAENSHGDNDEAHAVFQRLNAGKTPLTSSELIRALYMETGNDLTDNEKSDIAKEWDLIESEMGNEQFWAIWANERFSDVPTRMDFLFSIVLNVKSEDARHNPLLIYSRFEELIHGKCPAELLRKQWKEMLRCWWWMQSCYADVETFHLLGWLSLFTGRETRVLYREQWKDVSKCRMKVFKRELRKIIVESIGEGGFDSFRYRPNDAKALRKVFVLLNMLEAEQRNICFRVDLYLKLKNMWDIEHIASQTDNPLETNEAQEEWLRLAEAEMTKDEKDNLAHCPTFKEKWDTVWDTFGKGKNDVRDKDGMGNLALLYSGTNRSYKNAIFPAKRRRILLDRLADEYYVPPATEAAFEKSFSPGAAQMRYWGESDAVSYHDQMEKLFNAFVAKAQEGGK